MSCRYCNVKYKTGDTTYCKSKNTAVVYIYDQGKIVFHGDDSRTYAVPAKYCPRCGRELDNTTVRNTEQDYSNTIRDKIKEELKIERVGISDLSKKTGIAKSTLSDFLSGKIDCLSAAKIAVIADVLSLPVDELFTALPSERIQWR